MQPQTHRPTGGQVPRTQCDPLVAAGCPPWPWQRYPQRFISQRDGKHEMGQTPAASSLALVPQSVSKTTQRVGRANGCSRKPNLPRGEHLGESIKEVGEAAVGEGRPKHHPCLENAIIHLGDSGCSSPVGSPAGARDSREMSVEEASLFLTRLERKELLLSVYLLPQWPGHPARRSETCCNSASSPRGLIS